jgi:phosphate:Na+ symporter
MPYSTMVCDLAGGLAVFLYGMSLASEAFQKAAGRRLRILLELLTSNRFLGVGAGVAVTLATQSSSATTVLLVGLANSGLIQLGQSMGVILGADIGTTFTIQLIAFQVTRYGLLMVAAGAAVFLMSRYDRPRQLGEALMGVGFLFFGIQLMQEGMAPFQRSPWFREVLLSSGSSPLQTLIAAAAFTALLHSSAATLAVAIALASYGLFGDTPRESLLVSVPIVLGANIGTCLTAVLSSVGTNVEARRVALVHLLFKVAGAAVVLPFIRPFAWAVCAATLRYWPDAGAARLLANAHTAFNVCITCLFIGFTGPLARLVERLLPVPSRAGEEGLSLIPLRLVESPELALRSAEHAVGRLAAHVLEMYRGGVRAILGEDARLMQDVVRQDERADEIQRKAAGYIVELMRSRPLSEEAQRTCRRLFLLANELEKLGNMISRGLMNAAYVKMAKDVEFSIEGHKEMEAMMEAVGSMLADAVEVVSSGDPERAAGVRARRKQVLGMKIERQASHLRRLKRGLRDSAESSWCFLEIIGVLDSLSYRMTSVLHAIEGTDVGAKEDA